MTGGACPALAVWGGPPALAGPPGPVPEIDVGRDVLEVAQHQGTSALRSPLAGGGAVGQLEAGLEDCLPGVYALAVASGTAALHTALAALGVGGGDEVILSAYDWGAATAATVLAGARPVYADIDPATYTLDPADVAARTGRRTAAIIATHLLGQPADTPALRGLADQAGIALIEDAAQAVGALLQPEPTAVGRWADATCMSFGPGKLIDAGEGGALLTPHAEVFRAAVAFCQHPVRQLGEGLAPPCHFGVNHRIHPVGALMAAHGLGRARPAVARRRRAAALLDAALKNAPGILPPHAGRAHTYHRYSPTFDAAAWRQATRGQVVAALAAEGVPISLGPIRQPLHDRWHREQGGVVPDLPRTSLRCASQELLLWLPDPDGPATAAWVRRLGQALEKVWAHQDCLPGPSDTIRAGQ